MHYTTAAEAVKLIRSNDSVYIQGSTSIPETLVAAMAERGGELEHVTVYSAFAVGAFDAPYCRPEYKESFLVNSLFVANNIRRWLADGYGQTIPAFLGEIPALFRDGTLPLDVALINVSPPTPKATARSASRPIWRFPPWSAPRPSSRRSTGRCPTPTATP